MRSAARAELRKRALRELRDKHPDAYRDEVKRQIKAGLTQKQLGVLDAMARGVRYIALCCSRRAGKTNLISKIIVLTLLDAGHNEAAFFVAPTLQIGKGLIWKEVAKLCADYCLDEVWRMAEHTGEIHTPAGSAFFIQGLNKQKQGDKTRGFKTRLLCTDESQETEHLLGPLLTATAPALADIRGVFIAAGTPGSVPQGTWYEICHGTKGGFLAFHWTVRDNEKFPRDVDTMLREEREREGWAEDHPEYLKEWCGIWVQDVSTLMCEFLNERNSITELPDGYSLDWRHVIGIDYGWDDLTSWVVVAANRFGPERVVVHAEAHEKLDNDEAAGITARLVERFRTSYVVCDPAGGGKTFYETFNRRYGDRLGCQIKSANKLGKVESVKVINTELRTGRLVAYLPDAEPLAAELRKLRWKNRESGDVLTSRMTRDDCFDAFRYAMVEIAPWREKAVPDERANLKVEKARQEAEWRERCRVDPEAREIEDRNRRAREKAKEPLWQRR